MAGDTTPPRQIRIPTGTWTAYAAVCGRLGHTRSADILAHIDRMISTYGTVEEKAAHAAAQVEVARRSSLRGRPKRQT